MRDGLLCLGQPGGDGLAHAIQLHNLIAAVGEHLGHGFGSGAGGHRGRRRSLLRHGRGCGDLGCGSGSWLCKAFDVCLDDAAVRAASRDGRQIKAFFGSDAAGQGRGKNARTCRGGGCWRCGGNGGGLRRGCGGRSRDRLDRSGGGACCFAVFDHDRDRRVNLHASRAFGDQKLANDPLVDGLEFHGGLVGFDLGQDLAGFHRVALFHQPFGQRAFFHRRRERGHENFCCHVSAPYR